MGDPNYCRQEENAGGYGLGAAIGACGTKQTELVNAYSTLARMGVQKDISSVIEVKNSQGETLKKWKMKASKCRLAISIHCERHLVRPNPWTSRLDGCQWRSNLCKDWYIRQGFTAKRPLDYQLQPSSGYGNVARKLRHQRDWHISLQLRHASN